MNNTDDILKNYRGKYSKYWIERWGLIPELPTSFDNANSIYELTAWLQRAFQNLLDDFQQLESEFEDFKNALIDLLEYLIPELIRRYSDSAEFRALFIVLLQDILAGEERNCVKDLLKELLEVDMREWIEDYLKTLYGLELQELFTEVSQTKKDTVSLLQFGVIMNSMEDQSDKLQQAINYCIENSKVLYIPSGTIRITKNIKINNSIQIDGHNQSTYGRLSSTILYDNPSTDIEVITVIKDNGNTVPSLKLNNLYIGRKRNFGDDGLDESNLFAYGQKCIGIGGRVDESFFNNIVVLGFKTGIRLENSQITTIEKCDLLMNKTQVKIEKYFGHINIINNNICYSETTVEFESKGFTFNYNNNHAELSTNHFIFNIGEDRWGINNSIENVNIKNNNFTQSLPNTESFIKIMSKGTLYCYLRNLTIEGNRDYMGGGNPIVTQFNNPQTEVVLTVNNSYFLCDNPISGGDLKGNIKWNSDYYKKDARKWGSDTSYITPNISGINTAINTDFSNVYGGFDFKKYTFPNYPIPTEGRLFYNGTRNTFSFYNSKNALRMDIPLWGSHITTDNTPPSITDVINRTFVQNISGAKGSPLGWVFDASLNEWQTVGQMGTRTSGQTPIGNITPRFLGEEFLDVINKIWYKSVGLTNQDWKPLNS